MKRPLTAERQAQIEGQKRKIDEFFDGLYLDVQGSVGAPSGTKFTEEHIIRLVTRFAVSLCTAWWSLRELFDYIQNRKTFKDLVSNGTLS